jgi:hypothetical protein
LENSDDISIESQEEIRIKISNYATNVPLSMTKSGSELSVLELWDYWAYEFTAPGALTDDMIIDASIAIGHILNKRFGSRFVTSGQGSVVIYSEKIGYSINIYGRMIEDSYEGKPNAECVFERLQKEIISCLSDKEQPSRCAVESHE